MELPFEISHDHKNRCKSRWKHRGLIASDDEIESIYYMYIYATNCELCNLEFKSSLNRHMEHNHTTGEFRNIVCNSCNLRKKDKKKQTNNNSGYNGICKLITPRCKQGFRWRFNATVNGKRKQIKTCVDYDKLVDFANKWKIDNNYNT